jgi:hypothetical protein
MFLFKKFIFLDVFLNSFHKLLLKIFYYNIFIIKKYF